MLVDFLCPRCRTNIRIELNHEVTDLSEPVRLTCDDQSGPGCGWTGYLPVTRGLTPKESPISG